MSDKKTFKYSDDFLERYSKFLIRTAMFTGTPEQIKELEPTVWAYTRALMESLRECIWYVDQGFDRGKINPIFITGFITGNNTTHYHRAWVARWLVVIAGLDLSFRVVDAVLPGWETKYSEINVLINKDPTNIRVTYTPSLGALSCEHDLFDHCFTQAMIDDLKQQVLSYRSKLPLPPCSTM